MGLDTLANNVAMTKKMGEREGGTQQRESSKEEVGQEKNTQKRIGNVGDEHPKEKKNVVMF